MNFSRYRGEGQNENRINFHDQFIHAIPVMEKEVKEFFRRYLISIDGNEFWQKCYNELPYKELSEII